MIETNLLPGSDEPVVGRSVRLRGVRQDDYPWIFDVTTSASMIGRWRFRGAAPRPEEFVAALWANVHTQMVVESLGSERVGLVTSYNADPRSGHVRFAFLVGPDHQGRSWPFEGALLFLDHLFTHWPIRKVYVEGPEPVMDEIGLVRGLRGTFELEGRLIEHDRYEGRHVDLLIFGVSRQRFYDRFEHAIERRRQ